MIWKLSIDNSAFQEIYYIILSEILLTWQRGRNISPIESSRENLWLHKNYQAKSKKNNNFFWPIFVKTTVSFEKFKLYSRYLDMNQNLTF